MSAEIDINKPGYITSLIIAVIGFGIYVGINTLLSNLPIISEHDTYLINKIQYLV